MRRSTVHLALAAMLAVLPVLAFGAAAQSPQQALPVSVAEPLARRITLWDEYTGRFEAVQTVEVRARVSGFVDQIHFKDGHLVKAGDLLFTIEPRSFEISVESARAEVERTKAQVALQENEVERATPLVRSGATTKRELDVRSANLAVAQAQHEAAKAGLRAAQLNLDWTQIKAPISGRISDRKVDAGNLVIGGVGGATVLTNIVSLDPIHFQFDVSEADYMRYVRQFIAGARQSGRDVAHPVRIKLADDKEWARQGWLDFVDNQLNPRSGTLRGRAVFENKDQLFSPGLFARMQLFGGEVDALLVPDSAIVSDQTRKIVFVVGDDNLVAARAVELGGLSEGLRIVRSGLRPKDRVVIDSLANPMVRPGSRVAPQPTAIKAAAN